MGLTHTRLTFTAFRTPQQAKQTLTVNDLHTQKVRDATLGGKGQEQGQNELGVRDVTVTIPSSGAINSRGHFVNVLAGDRIPELSG